MISFINVLAHIVISNSVYGFVRYNSAILLPYGQILATPLPGE
jgi:hypothetical protein